MPLTVEAKAERKTDLAGWWKEAVRESAKNGNLPPVVIAKRKGRANGLDAWAIMSVRVLLEIMK